MSLARAWRRQLYGASSAALIVPCAMLAALMVLALAGGFRSVGVLGQIFAGPPAPPGPGASAGARAGAGVGGDVAPASGGAISVIPLTVAAAPPRRPAPRVVRTGGMVAVAPGGSSRTGGAIGPVAAVGPVVTPRPGAPAGPSPAQTAPARATPSRAGAQPTQSSPPPPPRKPTPVDGAVKLVTSVTQQVPAPAGPVATQVVQSAGSAANGLLPPSPAGALP